MRKIYLPFLTLVFFLTSCDRDEIKKNEKTVLVESLSPVKIVYQEKILLNGIAVPKKQYKLSFKIGGAIEKIYCETGQFVKKGQLLASLKQNEIQATVRQAESAFEKAKRDFQRVEKLYKDSVATLENYQDAKTALQVAEANYEIAKFNLQLSQIYSPANGKILMKIMEENEIVGPGMPVLVLGSDDNNWSLKVAASDKDKIKVSVNDKAEITIDALGDQIFEGYVSSISSMADLKTGLYDIEIDFVKPPKNLSAGFIGSANVFSKNKFIAYQISIEALAEAYDKTGILYDVSKNIAIPLEVEIIEIKNNQLIFKCDREPVKIAGKGSAYLKSGYAVEIKK